MHTLRCRGFTVVEIVVTITIMVVLLTMAVFVTTNQMPRARDNEREQDANNIARGLERYYDANNVYPHRSISYSIDSPVLPAVNDDDYYFSFNGKTPLAFKVSSVSGTSTIPADTSAITSNNDIIYLPLTWSIANNRWEACDSGELCSRFKLYYMLEQGNARKVIESRRQQ